MELPLASNSDASDESSEEELKETLSKRRSKELIVALSGPVGCGIEDVRDALERELKDAQYEVVHVKVSDLMKAFISQNDKFKSSDLIKFLPQSNCSQYIRISTLQELGNKIRGNFGDDICAQLAIQEIAIWRQNNSKPDPDDGEIKPDQLAVGKHTAFIIDQLKNPAEAELLSTVYNNIFYQVGILSTDPEKVQRLKNLGVDKADAVKLIEEDRNQEKSSGQKLEKTLSFSDYFVSNIQKNLTALRENIKRFTQLVHGVNGITPTNKEVGMYSAYSSSLRSACLSRQVGAAICDESGNVLSVGRNDVPKFKGGLYTIEDGTNDHRCINHGSKCFNTEHNNKLAKSIEDVLVQEGELTEKRAQELISLLRQNTPIGSLIEFSRAIHAEMDAILSLARSFQSSTLNTTIYTTTFPCHNCARHIVAAGITKVVYIEPYPKSLAFDLHNDSLCSEESSDSKVKVESFEGVAPTKYQVFFLSRGNRKDQDGKAVKIPIKDLNHIASDIVAKYTDTEKVVTKKIKEKVRSF